MTKTPNPIDRSLAFTALLETSWFPELPVDEGEREVTALLDRYYALPADDKRTLYDLGRDQERQHPDTAEHRRLHEQHPPGHAHRLFFEPE